MPIPLFIVERLKAAQMQGDQLAHVFAQLAQVADHQEIDDCAINLEFVQDADRLLPGDLIPMVTLSLERQQTVREPVNRSDVVDAECVPPFQPAEAATNEEVNEL